MSEDPCRSVELVQLAQSGDQNALNELFDRYYERVRSIVRLLLGNKLRMATESGDILQETFAVASVKFENFEWRDEASLIQWLSKLAEHQIIAAADYHGARKRDRGREVRLERRPTTHPAPDSVVSIGLPADVTAPLDHVDGKEQIEIVETCIHELPELYRELIILRDYTGASWESVAEQTRRPSAAAARMMHARALMELGKAVRNHGLQ